MRCDWKGMLRSGPLSPSAADAVLPAVAAAWALGLAPEAIRDGLRTYPHGVESAPLAA